MRQANRASAFTMIEIMVAVGILVVLATITVVLVGGVDTKAKTSHTQAQIKLLANAVTEFKATTGYFPLAVPEDAWTGNWDQANSFAGIMKFNARWRDYFRPGTDNRPDYTWDGAGKPTSIHMLVFQLEKIPESAKVLSQLKSTYLVETQQSFDGSGGKEAWTKQVGNPCKMGHPLDNNLREVYQPQDAWGTPLRFWTGDVLAWGRQAGWTNGTNGVLPLLSRQLQQANWGFFIESAGKNRKFGWWGDHAANLNAQDVEDNIYSSGGPVVITK